MISRRLLRIKALHLLYAYLKSSERSINQSEKELFFSINKVYDLYHYLFLLIIEVKSYAQNRIDINLNKRIPSEEDLNPNRRFVDNKFIKQLEENEAYKRYIEVKKISWVNYPELIKKLHNTLIEQDFYKSYMQQSECSFNDDKKLVSRFFEEVVITCEDIHSNLEEQSIYWNDDAEFVLNMMVKTIKKVKPGGSENPILMPLFKNDDDKKFVKTLFRKAATSFEENKTLIDKYTKNWEIDRIAFLDIIILNMAITETKEFVNIPIKVSLNEYIDISKDYSTVKSSVFINGVLDKLIKELVDNKTIIKVGRGLMDNK